MIDRLSHATIYVLDQEEARDFYVNKLGFEVGMDMSMEGFRWLTVRPVGQVQPELILMPTGPSPMMDEATSTQLRELVGKGVLGSGVFETSDCQRSYEEFTARGVEFTQPPTQQMYGIEAVFKDNSGNWFSLTQRTNQA